MRRALDTFGGSSRPHHRLPASLLKDIAVTAAANGNALSLACVCRSWHAAIFAKVLLKNVVLVGARQVAFFCQGIRRNTAGIRNIVAKTLHRLVILQAQTAHIALYDALERTRAFSREVSNLITEIAHACTCIESLIVQAESSALIPAAVTAQHTLREFFYLSSGWGGDHDTVLLQKCKAPLEYIQLHGPRLRLTQRLCTALSIPTLKVLALVVPGGTLAALETLALTTPSLEHIIVICHPEEQLVGNCTSARRGLQQIRRRKEHAPLRITLVTVALSRSDWHPSTHTRPELYSQWVFQRAACGAHWGFGDADQVATEDWIAPMYVENREPSPQPPSIPERRPLYISSSDVWGIDSLD